MALVKKQKRPTLFLVADREEIGSYGSAGAAGGNFIEYLATRAFEAAGLEPKWADVRLALMNSNCLSADVEGAIDPEYKEVHEELNSARLNHGACLIRYTGGAGKYGASEAGAEYMARVRAAFDAEGVIWQSSLLGKQEEGGGGTEALHMAAFGMNVVDCGPPVISMHSPFELSSKADLLMTVRAYAAFLRMD
jgi:aspartyl aminopeptidase